MNETQPIEQRQHGDIHALIRTISTKYGDMRTVTLHREWLGLDGRTRYAHDLRIRDIGPAIKLLADIAKAPAKTLSAHIDESARSWMTL